MRLVTKTNLFLIILIFISTLGLFYFNQQKAPEIETKAKSNKQMNFSRKGSILNWDQETQANKTDWILVYDYPGKPTNSVGLILAEEIEQGKFKNGDAVLLEGHKTNNQVTVFKMELLHK